MNYKLYNSFNTSMPPLNEGERQRFDSKEDNNADRSKSTTHDQSDDLEVYDFDAMKDGLDDYDDRDLDHDNLGDMLIEEGDDFNDETFGEATVGNILYTFFLFLLLSIYFVSFFFFF